MQEEPVDEPAEGEQVERVYVPLVSAGGNKSVSGPPNQVKEFIDATGLGSYKEEEIYNEDGQYMGVNLVTSFSEEDVAQMTIEQIDVLESYGLDLSVVEMNAKLDELVEAGDVRAAGSGSQAYNCDWGDDAFMQYYGETGTVVFDTWVWDTSSGTDSGGAPPSIFPSRTFLTSWFIAVNSGNRPTYLHWEIAGIAWAAGGSCL